MPRHFALSAQLALLVACLPALAACSASHTAPVAVAAMPAPPAIIEPDDGDIEGMISYYATTYKVPSDLVHSVVKRESGYNAAARNGPYWGLMQINPQTAHTMGYTGAADGLLNPRTNLTYAVKYLAGAYRVADGDPVLADRYYRQGYYYQAKSKGLLEELGLR